MEGEHVSIHAGFHSKLFGDGTSVEFDLCEQCLHALVKGLKVPALWKEDE